MAPREFQLPPLGVRLKVDIEAREGARGTRYWARVRWHDPGRAAGGRKAQPLSRRSGAWIERMRRAARPASTMGRRWRLPRVHRGPLDPRHRPDVDLRPLLGRPRLRVLPTLGHLPVTMITAGLVDRAIDQWEQQYGRSTVKNSVAALVLVLDEAVRDGIIVRNPAKDRAADGRLAVPGSTRIRLNPRDLALPDVTRSGAPRGRRRRGWRAPVVRRLVTILATTALRISEVSGLRSATSTSTAGCSTSPSDLPGSGWPGDEADQGPAPADRADHRAAPTDARTAHRRPRGDERLVTGPRGGVITTATLRDATNWDDLVRELGCRAWCATACGTRH